MGAPRNIIGVATDDPVGLYDWWPEIDLETRDNLIGTSNYPYDEEAEMDAEQVAGTAVEEREIIRSVPVDRMDDAQALGLIEVERTGGPLTQAEALVVQLGLVSLALQIVRGKRRNYSGTEDPFRNFRTSVAPWGLEPWEGAGVRMMDKWARTRSILEMGEQVEMGPEPQEKLLIDWADAHNYTDIIAGLVIEELPDRDELIEELRQRAGELPRIVEELLADADIGDTQDFSKATGRSVATEGRTWKP